MSVPLEVQQYYETATTAYLRYGGSGGWHYGLWLDGVDNHADSLERATELLFEGIDVDPSMRILDVGCGVGDLARWCADRYGCEVLGLTIVPEHVALAEKRCHAVADRVRFEIMDMNALDLGPERFDVVINQETLCYVVDPGHYFEHLRAALAPGGFWRAVEFSRQEEISDPTDVDEHRRTLEGFAIPALHTPAVIGQALAKAGFVDREAADLTNWALPTAQLVLRGSEEYQSLMNFGLTWTASPWGDRSSLMYAHFDAGAAYSRGLLRGWARHMHYRARAPEA